MTGLHRAIAVALLGLAAGACVQQHPDWLGPVASSGGSDSSSGTSVGTEESGTEESGTEESGTEESGTEESGTAVCDPAQLWDFTRCPQGWTAAKAHPQASEPTWACGEAVNGPGPVDHPGQWATGLDGNYEVLESGALVSPILDLSGCEGEALTLVWEHWWAFEGGIQNYDGALMQVSIDGGTNWAIVEPEVNGYFYDESVKAWYSPVTGEFGWCSHKDAVEQTWVVSELDLGPYAGNPNLRVRFVVGSDDTASRAGWYIDWVELRVG